jgi:triosephosphate isomerase
MGKQFIAILTWEPFYSLEDTQRAIQELESHPTVSEHRYLIALPYHYLNTLSKNTSETSLILGLASMNSVSQGSFTVSITMRMLQEAKAKFVLLGTSKNRKLGLENSEDIHKKISLCIEADIMPIICVGENLEEYQSDRSETVLNQQLSESLGNRTEEEWAKLQIVYEGPWMNQTAFPPELNEIGAAFNRCRQQIDLILGSDHKSKPKLLCGLPFDIKDLASALELIPSDGFFLRHTDLNLEMLSAGLHLAAPKFLQDAPAPSSPVPPSVEEKEGVERITEAVLVAAKEAETTGTLPHELKELEEEPLVEEKDEELENEEEEESESLENEEEENESSS